jgi:hypothetical protein
MHDGAVQEQRNRIGIAQRPLTFPPIRQPQRFEPIDGFAEKAKRLAAGHKYSQCRAVAKQVANQLSRGLQDMLAVVEYQQ